MNKKAISGFLMLCTAISLYAQDVNVVDAKGNKQGVWAKKQPNGTPIYQGQFVDNYETGWFTYYYKNGDIKGKTFFSEKGKKAESETYYPSGKLMAKGNYWQRKKDSIWTYYRENGRVSFTETYNNGAKNGKSELFDMHGVLNESYTWKDDKKHGTAYRNLYFAYIYYCYSHDQRDGAYEEFYKSQKLRLKGSYKQDRKHGEWVSFDESSNPIKKELWDHGKLIKETVVLRTANQVLYVSANEIMMFKRSGSSGSLVVMNNGNRYEAANSTSQLADVLGMEEFIMINTENQTFCRYSFIKGINASEVKTDPVLPFPILADEDGRKALNGAFSKSE